MIKINLGLNNNPYKTKKEIKFFFSTNFIINNETFDFKIVKAKYINPVTQKIVVEKTAVFNIHPKKQKNKQDIDFNIKQLCSIFKQDSIAYFSEILNIKYVQHNIRYTKNKYTFNKKFFKF